MMKPTLMRPGGLPATASTPVVTPLMPSVVYASDTPDQLDAQYEGRMQGYTYAREGHPNADVLARRIDAMEGAPVPGKLGKVLQVPGLVGEGARCEIANREEGESKACS